MSKIAVFAALVAAAAASSASASTVSFTRVSGNTNPNIASQLSATFFSDTASRVRIAVTNSGPVASSVANVYFDSGSSADLSSIHSISNVGTSIVFASGGSPASLPNANSFVTNPNVRLAASSPSPSRGINPGETLSFFANLANGVTYSSLLTQLASGDIRLGLHVIAIGTSQGSDSFVSASPVVLIPSPAAGIMGLAGLGAVAARRRRA